MGTTGMKSIVDLIDETLSELEELQKSRFSAAEVKIDGPGKGIDGHPSDGHIEKDEDKKEDEEDKDEDKKDKAEKSEDKEMKSEDKDAPKKEEAKEKEEEAKKAESPSPEAEEKKMRALEMKKKEDEDKEKEDKKKKEMEDKMKKSQEETTSLMKSFVDERVKPLEDKMTQILDLVNKLADQPVAPKGATARVVPLAKSADEGVQPLSKSEVASKLFELKKSGGAIETLDIAKAEMGQDLESIVKKYQLT